LKLQKSFNPLTIVFSSMCARKVTFTCGAMHESRTLLWRPQWRKYSTVWVSKPLARFLCWCWPRSIIIFISLRCPLGHASLLIYLTLSQRRFKAWIICCLQALKWPRTEFYGFYGLSQTKRKIFKLDNLTTVDFAMKIVVRIFSLKFVETTAKS